MSNTTSNQEMSIDFNNILQQAKKIMEKAEKFDKDKLNILIIGKSGVGKSTLLNAIFGENFAKTGSGKPVTQHITDYQKDNLTIYDSKGLELKDTSAFEEIENFIETQKTKSVNEQIHLAWLCISEGGRRVEEREKELYGILKNNNIPTIIVITKAQQDKDEKGVSFQEVVKELFNTDKVMRVRASEVEDDDGEIKKIKGVQELINYSYNLLPEAQQKAFARKQEYDKAMKRQQMEKDAKEIINYYAVASAAPCASPIPFSDIALILPIQAAMIVHLSKIYGLELDMESAKKVTIGLLGVCAAGFAVRAGLGGLLKFVPVIGTIAGATINATVTTATTKTMGEVYRVYLDGNYENILKGIVLSFDFSDIKIGQIK